jgi:hypothetical protein
MKLCKKCKVPIDDMTDGCAKCKPWKENWLVEDVAGNSLYEEIDHMRRMLRNVMLSMDHTRKMAIRKGEVLDTEFLKNLDSVTKSFNRLFSMVQALKKDGKAAWAKMSVADQTKAIARVLVSKSKEDRRKILGLADEMERDIAGSVTN